VPDRADAALALGALRNDAEAMAALGDAAQHDSFWGVRAEALRALGKVDGADAEKQVFAGLSDQTPWVREIAVRTLASFKQDTDLTSRLTDMAAHDPAYRVRAAALRSLAEVKAPNAFVMLAAAVDSDSPDGILRDAALGGFGALGDARAVSTLLAWSSPGKPLNSREEAVSALGELDKKNPSITQTLVSYLQDSHFDLRITTILALGARGDPSAVPPLEQMRKNGDRIMDEGPYLDTALSLLKTRAATQ